MDVERVKEQIHPSWHEHLLPEFEKPYMIELREFLRHEVEHTFYPPAPLIFNALRLTPLDSVVGFAMGQDPYHQPSQAMGLAFSVPKSIKPPPSLKRIFKELEDDVQIQLPGTGDLTPWAKQGVLLLNSVLTVQAGLAGSHAKKGWEQLTDTIIAVVSRERAHCSFMLWGNYARKKKELIDESKHLVLEAAHPSPLATTGFLGCRHFSKTNEYLRDHDLDLIDWRLPD